MQLISYKQKLCLLARLSWRFSFCVSCWWLLLQQMEGDQNPNAARWEKLVAWSHQIKEGYRPM